MVALVGDRIPDVEVQVLGDDGFPKPVRTGEVLGTGKVVLFSVPGAFTPGCTHIHLPGFISGYDELAGKGVDKVACVAVNDPWVMEAWAESTGAEDILMLSDGNGEFARGDGAHDGCHRLRTRHALAALRRRDRRRGHHSAPGRAGSRHRRLVLHRRAGDPLDAS